MAVNLPQPLPVIPPIEEVKTINESHIEAHRSLLEKILTSVTPETATYENVVLPLENLRNALDGENVTIDAMKYGSPSLEYQKAVEAAQKTYREYYVTSVKPELHALLQAVHDRHQDLDEESQKVLEKRLSVFTHNGFGKLDDANTQKVNERDSRIAELRTTFLRNIREEESAGEWFTPEEVDGVPAEDLEPVSDDSNENNGKAFYSYAKKYTTILENAHSPETRRRMMEGDNRRCPENAPIFREAILLRDENARTIGAASHAATKIPNRLSESIEWLDQFLGDMAETLGATERKKYEGVAAERRRDLKEKTGEQVPEDENDSSVPPWDMEYYAKRLGKNSGPDHSKAFEEYFPLRHSFSAVLEIFAAGLQLRCTPLSPEQLASVAWHHDIEGWSVWDERADHKDEFIGYLFTDLLPRPHKYKGYQSVTLEPGYVRPDGTRKYPSNTLMMSLDIEKEKGYPLTPRLLRSMSHELGHSLHDLVSRTQNARFHGVLLPLELGEGVGTMMEQWSYVPDFLRKVGMHYAYINPAMTEAWHKANPGKDLPPKEIPEYLVEWQAAQRAKNIRNTVVTRLFTSLFDMAVHNPPNHEALLQMDESVVYNDCFEKTKGRRLPENIWPQATEYILFSGYDAGFYAYIGAQVLGIDFFEHTFAADPFSTEAWERFREGILIPGGSKDCRALVKKYLGGRLMSPKALYSVLGVDTAAT